MEFTREDAIAFYEREGWKEMTNRELIDFQFSHGLSCMPMDVLLEAAADVFGRSVYNIEFGLNWEGLKQELYEDKEPPTIVDIIEMLPHDKKIIILGPKENE